MTPHKQPLWSRSVAAALAMSMGIDSAGMSEDPGGLMGEARRCRDKGDIRAAIDHVQHLLRSSETAQARHLLAELHLDQGDLASAEEQCQAAIAMGIAPYATSLLLAKILLARGQFERLLAELPRSVPAGLRPALLSMRAAALLGLHNIDQAAAMFAEALSLEPESADALLGLSRIAAWRHQPQAAASFLSRALHDRPGDIDCLRFQADLWRAQGCLDTALAAQRDALERRPGHAPLLVGLAELQTDAGILDGARASLAAARRSAGSGSAVLYAEALLHLREEKFAQAKEVARRILRSDNAHTPALLMAGALHLATDDLPDAEQHLQRFLRAVPEQATALELMATLHLRASHPEAAIALLTPLLDSHPTVALLTLAAQANMTAGHFSPAAALLDRAATLAPPPEPALRGIARSRMGGADHERALCELARAIGRAGLAGQHAQHARLLVDATMSLQQRQYDRAAAVLAQLPDDAANPLEHRLQGELALALGNSRAARSSFQQCLLCDAAFLPALLSLEQLDAAERKPFESTRNRYLAALGASPGNIAVMDALARLALAHGHPMEALAWLERAHAENPASLALALRKGQLLLQLGETARALAFCNALRTTHSADTDVLLLLGQACLAASDFRQATNVFSELATQQPGRGLPHVYLASVCVAQHQDAQALACLKTALALEPDLLPASAALTALLTRHGRYAEALNAALAVQRRQPAEADAYQLEGDIHSAQQHHAAAEQAYARAFSLEPSGPRVIQHYGALLNMGQATRAHELMQAWCDTHPEDDRTRLCFARSLLAGGHLDGAVRELEQILIHAPEHLEALNDLAWTCQRRGDGKALSLAQRAHALAPDNPAVMDTLAWILTEQGELTRALPLLHKAAALAPQTAEIQFHYGAVLARSGEHEAARKSLEKALASATVFPGREQARMLLARL